LGLLPSLKLEQEKRKNICLAKKSDPRAEEVPFDFFLAGRKEEKLSSANRHLEAEDIKG